MRFLLCVVLLLSCAVSATAQHFDIWDGPRIPRLEYATFPYQFTTQAQALAYAKAQLPMFVHEHVDDFLAVSAIKMALLAHMPNTNTVTQSILSGAVPTGDTAQREIRFVAAFKREVELSYATYAAQVDVRVAQVWQQGSRRDYDFYQIASIPAGNLMRASYRRARQIEATMTRLETQHMSALASDVDFIRNSALVTRGEQNGFRLSAGQQNLHVTVDRGDTPVLVAPLRFVDCRQLHRIGIGTANTATAHVVPKGGAVTLTVGTGAVSVVRQGVLRTLTAAELKLGVSVQPIDVPTVSTHLSNQSFEVSTETTVDYSDVFTGSRLTYAVTSSQPSVATVRLGEAGILVVRAVAAGNTTITLTASNESGNAVTTFIATVTASSE